MTINVEIADTVEEKDSQQSVEFITSLPTTVKNDFPSKASIHSLENRLFVEVSELSQKNLPLHTPSYSGTAYTKKKDTPTAGKRNILQNIEEQLNLREILKNELKSKSPRQVRKFQNKIYLNSFPSQREEIG